MEEWLDVGYQGCGRKNTSLMRWVDCGVTGPPWWDKSTDRETGERAGGRQSEFYTKGGELGVPWKENGMDHLYIKNISGGINSTKCRFYMY